MNFIKVLFVLSVALLQVSCATQAKKRSWIDQSDKFSKRYSLEMAEMSPESGSQIGFRQFDSKASSAYPEQREKYHSFFKRWATQFAEAMKSEADPDVKIDLKIMYDKQMLALKSYEMDEKYGVIDVPKGSLYTYYGLMGLVNPQSSKERKLAAVDRFHLYVNGQNGHLPIMLGYKQVVLSDLKRLKKKRYMPLRASLKKYLKESPQYVAGIESLLKQSGRTDWMDDFKKFKKQTKIYDVFVKKQILPIARTDFRMPIEYYEHHLKYYGVYEDPKQLYKRALKDFGVRYKEFEALAKKLAIKHNLKKSDPVSVIRFLKKDLVLDKDKAVELYKKADSRITDIIEKHKIVTLPKLPLRIRAGSAAESVAQPVPHLTSPSFLNNKGERPEFVVPVASKGKVAYDDFIYASAAAGLTSHEGRPGHDLQFSTIIDKGISIIRATYAMNSANVEGWALYAEQLVFPYLSDEEKLASRVLLLARVVRAFCDPGLQLGKISKKECTNYLVNKVGISKEFAKLEIERYTFKRPGQATAYYYGMGKIFQLKDRVMAQSGSRKISERCFNDKVLSKGLLPLDILDQEVRADLKDGCDM